MLLQELKIENIRSYTNETIRFPEGSTILSGDIGSGKSSILLAIEFALFGTSRTDLPAELLLRKGATTGSVELKFKIKEEEIIIKRNLKKEKKSIKQLAGYIIKNDVKKELMPIELKTEVISLLGYPEDLISKKNFLFRYTVYTPQEEMKFILQENAEIRLDALRKIFNIDKYKTVRENVQFFLKKMRVDIATAKTRLELFDDKKQKLENITLGLQEVQRSINELKPSYIKVKEEANKEKEKIVLLEKKWIEFQQLLQQYKTAEAMIQENLTRQERNKLAKEKVMQDLEQIQIEDIEEVEKEFQDLTRKKEEIILNRNVLEQESKNILGQISVVKKDVESFSPTLLKGKMEESKKIKLVVDTKENIMSRQKQLEDLLVKTTEIVSKNNTLLESGKMLMVNMTSLAECPTCLQNVPHEHKSRILEEEGIKVRQAEKLLEDSRMKKEEILARREQVARQIAEVQHHETLYAEISTQITLLQEKKAVTEEKKEVLKELVQKNNLIMSQRAIDTGVDKIVERIKVIQEMMVKSRQKKLLMSQLESIKQEVKETNESLLKNEMLKSQIEEKIKDNPQEELNLVKHSFQEKSEKEKELGINLASITTQERNLIALNEEVLNEVNKLKEIQSKLIRRKELYHWLDTFFLSLTFTIEKQIMTSIHSLFNQFFQEWFTILIDDNDIYARIDDSFSPVIEQNGYEVSFHNLSGGEKTSAALAYRLALNRVINDIIHQIKTKDLLILDEPTDGFSSEQLDKVRDVLDRLQLRQTIIVSHESKIESFVDNIVRIRKEGHVSSVV
jgi:DNA repair protein SbcC/Rad50